MRRCCIKRARVSATSLEDVWISLMNLNAGFRTGLAKGDADMRWLVAEATRICRNLDAWRDGVSCEREYRVVPLSTSIQDAGDDVSPEGPFGRFRHVYENHWTVEVWNKWRITKILVHDLILQHYPPQARSAEMIEACESTIRSLSEDVCLSLHSSRKSRPNENLR